MRGFVFFVFFSYFTLGFCQVGSLRQQKKIAVKDSVQLDSLSIQSFQFKLLDFKEQPVDTSLYTIDFSKAKLYLKPNGISADSLKVSYFKYPSFITKKYSLLDTSLIIPKNTSAQRLYKLTQSNTKNNFTLFDGLNANGSISRGIRVGNNQNSVFNSELDLQLFGKLSENITLKASLQDNNIPIQEGGYSQSLDEFDQIFIELTGKKWGIRAGDIQVQQQSTFASFSKKLQGLSLKANLDGQKSQTEVYASGALVRGIFNSSNIIGQEGNQGPYKLIGQNGELFVLIVSGSERVYVNGLLLKRGENNDYVIDYNAGEIRFNPTFPITSEMRIFVEYQTSQRNFARAFGFSGGNYTSKKWKLSAFIYSENDLKNQSLQQDLTDPQKQILSEAGDDVTKMIAPSAVPDTFSENKILYEIRANETTANGDPIYDFSQDESKALFQVRFTRVQEGQGNYTLRQGTTSIGRIFDYNAGNGNFEPIIQLQAPDKLQLGVVMGTFAPNPKTNIEFELAGSNNDLNLFSNTNDSDNQGGAVRLKLQQQVFSKDSLKSKINVFGALNYVQKTFRNVERLYNVEFNRDWNLPLGTSNQINDQILSNAGLQWNNPNKGDTSYTLQYLELKNQYKGARHLFNANLKLNNWNILQNSSLLNSSSNSLKSTFLRSYTAVNYGIRKAFVGGKFSLEDNNETQKTDNQLTPNSQKYQSYEAYTGVGDSTSVFIKVGYRYRENDSLQNGLLNQVSKASTMYLNSKLIDKPATQLSLFVNYRIQDDVRETEKDKSLNSRLIYRQRLWKNKVQWNTLFETQNGNVPQQEFTYVKVDPGRGLYTWNDYNNDGIQDLQEFELSPFPDQATYIRVLLPRQTFVKTFQNKLSQQLSFNLQSWEKATTGFKKIASHFYNQTSYTIDREVRRQGNDINLNIFKENEDDLGLNLNLRNSLFFNRGKQHYTTSYTYLQTAVNQLLTTGRQKNKINSHQVNFTHKIKESWLFESNFENSTNTSEVESTTNRDFKIKENNITPKVSYLFNDQASVSLAYSFNNKQNTFASAETLKQQKLTASFRLAAQQKATLTGSFDWFENKFTGNAFSPVAYQLLEGLQPGTNFTWNVLVQKKITKFLELNLDYSGRKTKISKTIHNGSVQLRAFF